MSALSNRLAILIAALILITAQHSGGCCVGARPLAMGGAFTGLADDANATYWNPAGLVGLKSFEIATMHTITNRGGVNYQEYVALAMPFESGLAAGASWINTNQAILDIVSEENWYWLSLAYQVSDGIAVGINIKSLQDSFSEIENDTAVDGGVLFDLNDKLRLGLLIQNANEPDITLGGNKVGYWAQNWRPGLSIRPDKASIVSMELYDATDDGGMRSFRIGYERKLDGRLIARCGYYGLGCSENDAFTLGLGVAGGKSEKSDTKSISLDLAMMFGDIDTLFGSLNFKF